MPDFCKPCAERGRPGVLAHRIVNGEGMCADCFGGNSKPGYTAPRKIVGVDLRVRPKEKPMNERKCSECGNKLHHLVKGDTCRKCRGEANGKSVAGGGAKRKKRRPNSYGRHAKPNGGLTLTVPATDELCQQRWEELDLAQKVALLNSLSE